MIGCSTVHSSQIPGANNNLTISNLDVSDAGEYVAQVSNPAFPGFSINSVPQYVTVTCASVPAGSGTTNATRVTFDMEGTTPGETHPAHIHMNSAATGGSIVLSFNRIDGTTGESVTVVDAFDNSTPVTTAELLNYNGHVIVHVAGAGVGAAVAVGDIGSNAPDSMGVYRLAETGGSGVSGTVTFESATDADEDSKVDRVVLGTIDNNTAGTTCEVYSDFTDISTDLSKGQSSTVSVTLGTCDVNYPKFGKVYIDWNLDGVFAETEVVASNAVPIDTTGTFEGTFSVPDQAIVGTSVKMRVVCWEAEYVSEGVTNFDLSAVTSCSGSQYVWGETEDYTINIVEPSLPDLAPQVISFDPTTIAAGTSANATVRVLNNTSVDAAASTLSYVLSTDAIFDDSDVFLGESPSGAIVGFEFSEFAGTVLIPGNTAAGDYNVIFVADALDEVSESDESNNFTAVAISVTAAGDTINPSVTYLNRPEGYVIGSGGFEISVRATDADSGVDTVGVFFKKITDPGTDLELDFEFRGARRSTDNRDEYTTSFNDTDFGTLGIEYLFVALDSAGNVGFTNLIPVTTTVAFESVNVTGLTAGDAVVDYELISFPLVFDNPSPNSIFDELGTYSTDVWRLFYWNNGSQSYTERPSSVSAGLGYWLIFANQVSISIDNARAVDATLTRPFTISLRNGWNQIGSPYLAALSWSDVLDHNITEGIISSGDVGNPFTYNRAFSEATQLSPFEGAFVEANGTIQLEIPLQAVSGIGGRFGSEPAPPRTSSLESSDWEVRFDLNAGEYHYRIGGLGMHPGASEEKDEFDRSTLPRLGQYLDINFAHPEHIIPFFSRDIVPSQDQFTWEFTIESTLDEKKTILEWDNSFFGANQKHLFLFDQDLQKAIDMREVGNYEFQAGEKRHFKAIYGDLEYIESEIRPNRLTLGDAYPNPFNQQTIIPYSLPKSDREYRINLSVFNSLGQKVVTLVDEEQSTGYYEVLWNGRSDRGASVEPGIYIYQLKVSGLADNPVLNGKLIVR